MPSLYLNQSNRLDLFLNHLWIKYSDNAIKVLLNCEKIAVLILVFAAFSSRGKNHNSLMGAQGIPILIVKENAALGVFEKITYAVVSPCPWF